MKMDVITIKIKIKNDELEFDEKTDLIKSHLKSLIDRLDETNGNVQQLKGQDEDSTIEYVHLKND
jgi:hypothetical protein